MAADSKCEGNSLKESLLFVGALLSSDDIRCDTCPHYSWKIFGGKGVCDYLQRRVHDPVKYVCPNHPEWDE